MSSSAAVERTHTYTVTQGGRDTVEVCSALRALASFSFTLRSRKWDRNPVIGYQILSQQKAEPAVEPQTGCQGLHVCGRLWGLFFYCRMVLAKYTSPRYTSKVDSMNFHRFYVPSDEIGFTVRTTMHARKAIKWFRNM